MTYLFVFVAMALDRIFVSDTPILVITGALMIALVGANYWKNSWKCPRCGKPFRRKWYGRPLMLLIVTKCVHGGLPKWSSE